MLALTVDRIAFVPQELGVMLRVQLNIYEDKDFEPLGTFYKSTEPTFMPAKLINIFDLSKPIVAEPFYETTGG